MTNPVTFPLLAFARTPRIPRIPELNEKWPRAPASAEDMRRLLENSKDTYSFA
jgi:hypothetical protein